MDYSIEEQLERIQEEVDGFFLEKPVWEMSEEEIREAKKEASIYVDWLDDENYIQQIPVIKRTGRRIYPL